MCHGLAYCSQRDGQHQSRTRMATHDEDVKPLHFPKPHVKAASGPATVMK